MTNFSFANKIKMKITHKLLCACASAHLLPALSVAEVVVTLSRQQPLCIERIVAQQAWKTAHTGGMPMKDDSLRMACQVTSSTKPLA